MKTSAYLIVLCILLQPLIFSLVTGQDSTLFPIEVNNKWGYCDHLGEMIITPDYYMALPFTTGGIGAVVDDSGWVYINFDGLKLLRPFIIDNGPDYFSEGLARFVKDGKLGFFDESGKIVIPAQFTFVQPFSEGLAAFCSGCHMSKDGEYHQFFDGKWGFIDRQGKIIIPAKYEQVKSFQNGSARVSSNRIWYQIDYSGKIIKEME